MKQRCPQNNLLKEFPNNFRNSASWNVHRHVGHEIHISNLRITNRTIHHATNIQITTICNVEIFQY